MQINCIQKKKKKKKKKMTLKRQLLKKWQKLKTVHQIKSDLLISQQEQIAVKNIYLYTHGKIDLFAKILQ